MISTIFHDEDGTQMSVFVNSNARVVIQVGNVFGDVMESNLIVLDDDDIAILIKELEEQKRLSNLM